MSIVEQLKTPQKWQTYFTVMPLVHLKSFEIFSVNFLIFFLFKICIVEWINQLYQKYNFFCLK